MDTNSPTSPTAWRSAGPRSSSSGAGRSTPPPSPRSSGSWPGSDYNNGVDVACIRTHTGLDDSSTLPLTCPEAGGWGEREQKTDKTWNVEVFIKSVHELQTTLNWKEIIYELDHAGFCVKDRAGLILLMKALKLGLQTQGLQVSCHLKAGKLLED